MELGQLILFFCLVLCGTIGESSARKNRTWRPPNADEIGNELPDEIISSDEGGVYDNVLFWPDNRIPYEITGNFDADARELILEAMEEIHNTTCIRFVQRTTEPIYIPITSNSQKGCRSGVGYKGKVYSLNLSIPGCIYRGTILHELAHAIGLFHEHTRSDRDNYVTINWENIEEDAKYNFVKKANYDVYEEPYNYDSIVHYSEFAFSKNRLPTVEPKNDVEIGQRNSLSQGDINTINRRYKCHQQSNSRNTRPTGNTVDESKKNSNGQWVTMGGVIVNRNDYTIVTSPDGTEYWYPKNVAPTPAPTRTRVMNPIPGYITTGYDGGFTGTYTPGGQYPYSGYYRQTYYIPQYPNNGYPQQSIYTPTQSNFGLYPQTTYVISHPNHGYNAQYTHGSVYSFGDSPQAAQGSKISGNNAMRSARK